MLNYWVIFMGLSVQLTSLATTSLYGREKQFGDDVAFLSEHVETIVLGPIAGEATDARIAVVPAYQGRVMTSTSGGTTGISYGWINYDHIASGKVSPQINVYGGEERFWLGPEGGQFGLFFPPRAAFEFANWSTPAVIDTEPFQVSARSDRQVSFEKESEITNYADTKFSMHISREVELLSSAEVARSLGREVESLACVGYRTLNRVTNRGKSAWTKAGGLPSIWLLGMYKHGAHTTVVLPFRKGSEIELGPIVNDNYFGKVPPEFLKVGDGIVFFSGNGRYRSKVGLSPKRSLGICASLDADRGVLTVVKYEMPGPAVSDYVNSMWAIQEHPFGGDVINAYNDGPTVPGGKPLGPFYELETSSPALALRPGETGSHLQETFHIEGDRQQLDVLARALLGVSLDQIEAALPEQSGH